MVLTSWEEAQRAVIGSLLIDPDNVAGIVFASARREQFSNAAYLHVFEAALSLWQDRKPVDVVTVAAAAGDAYAETLADAMRATPTAANIEAYLELLRKESRLHALQGAAAQILEAKSEEEAAAVWDRLSRNLLGAERVRRRSLTDCISAYLDRMADPEPPDYLTFGIPQIDKRLHIGRGKMIILAADSSTGKTAMALQFAHSFAAAGKKVGFFSLETDSDSLTDRLMAETAVAGIALPRSMAKALSTADYKRAVEAGDRSSGICLDLIDRVSRLEEIRMTTIACGYDVIVVDYLQIIDAPGEKRSEIVTAISIYLHRMAQTLGVTILALSQITPPEKGSTRELTMDDLRESRQLKHDADVILLLTPDKIVPAGRRLTVAKDKQGKQNLRFLLQFDAEHMTFRYAKRVETSGQPVLAELGDEEGGELPF